MIQPVEPSQVLHTGHQTGAGRSAGPRRTIAAGAAVATIAVGGLTAAVVSVVATIAVLESTAVVVCCCGAVAGVGPVMSPLAGRPRQDADRAASDRNVVVGHSWPELFPGRRHVVSWRQEMFPDSGLNLLLGHSEKVQTGKKHSPLLQPNV